ncbi:MAG TPA: hypothetical protein VEK11_06095 [Thermoanaerobaculia bacterium]|jgi:hypothetical protein|nr:hypothetical protein [Thermoanaerobaculia bacterium]
MRKLLAASLLLLAACASQGKASRASIAGIQIIQTSEVPAAARYVQGGVNVQYAVRVTNLVDEPLTLRRVTVQSLGEGAYHVQHSMSYEIPVGPAQEQDVQFWAPAQTGRSLVGANGPVTVRVTAEFDSKRGRVQEIVTRVVNDRTAITGEQ